MKKVLKIENLKKYYGVNTNITKAVDGISFSVLEGEFVANCVATIDTVTSGHIFVDNKDITTVKENEFTKLFITFPKSKLHNIND